MSATAEPSAPAAKGGRFWKIVALAFMVAVIGGECLVAFIYLSTAGQKSAQAEIHEAAADGHDSHGHGDKAAHGKADKGHGEKPKHDAHGKPEDDAKHDSHGKKHDAHGGHDAKDAHAEEEAEDHGDHGSSGGHGGHGGEHEMDLGQYSLTVYQPASNTSLLVDFHLYGTISAEDEHDFDHMFESSKHRIRDQVIVTVRSAEMTDFADPGLGLIKRQILEKSNATLGKRYLRAIVFSDFTLLEQ